uniref:Uncharacterized protein n=1 Tax=Terrapene triunguis TaxID=2587831 RepID=A0A674I092_9SAUR
RFHMKALELLKHQLLTSHVKICKVPLKSHSNKFSRSAFPCLSVCPAPCPRICLPLSVCLHPCPRICLPLSVCPSPCPRICLPCLTAFPCLSVCPSLCPMTCLILSVLPPAPGSVFPCLSILPPAPVPVPICLNQCLSFLLS